MVRVFVSHAGEDVTATDRIHAWLVESGHEVFLDRDPQRGIAPGDEWQKRLHERLRWAEAVVCVVTMAYTRSTWCTAEAAIAMSRGARVVPVLAEQGVRHTLFTPLQYLDATGDACAARERLTIVLRDMEGSGRSLPDGVSPYPGLRPFDVDRRLVFFGREPDITRLGAALRSPAEQAESALFVLVGPSGCGKSSLVRAGLLPSIAEEPDQFTLGACVPGQDPVGAVVRELAESATRRLGLAGWTIECVRRRVAENGLAEVVDELLLAVPGRRRVRLVLVLDQFEELLTQAPPAARAEFAELVGPAVRGRLQIVVTLRPEFLQALLSSPELATLRKVVHTLEPLNRASLATVIEKPAELAGIEIEDGLVDQLLADTGTGDALPLLAYTLAELAEGVTRGGRLTLARYEQLGGVQGTLQAQADAALAAALELGGRSRDDVIKALIRLVVIDEQGRPTRMRVPRSELPADDAAALDEFVRRRLLVTDRATEGDDRTAVVGVAHEAFLTAWPPLADALRRDPMALRAQRQLDQAANRWVGTGRRPRELWSGSQLHNAVVDVGAELKRTWFRAGRDALVTRRVDLRPSTADFLSASIVRPRRLRQGLLAVLSVLLLITTVIGVIADQQRRLATEQQRLAVARQLLAEADSTRVGDARNALLLGLAAQSLSPGPEARANLMDTLTHTRYSRTLQGDTVVTTVAFSPDGRTLVVGGVDGQAVLWDLADPQQPAQLGQPLPAQHGYVYDVAFSHDGRTLAAAGADRTVVLWDMTDRAAPRPLGSPLAGHPDDVHAIAFSDDDHVLASVGFAGRLFLDDVTEPAVPRRLSDTPTGHTDSVVSLAFAPGRPVLATAGFDHTVRLWDVADPSRPTPIGPSMTARDSALWAVAFAPDGRTLAAVDAAGYLLRWDVGSPSTPQPIGSPVRAHLGPAYALAFSHDGSRIATVGADRDVNVWSLADPARPSRIERLTGHADQVYAVDFARDDRTLASAGVDRTAVLWDLTESWGPLPLGPPLGTGTGRVDAMSVSPDGHWLAFAGDGGTIEVWDVADPARARPRADPIAASGEVRSLAFSPGASVLAAATSDGALTLWDTSGAGPPRQLGTTRVVAEASGVSGIAYSVAFAPDGRRVAVAGGDRSVSLWDVTDPVQPTRIGAPATDHTGPVYSVAFSPTGSTLASGGEDGSVLVWDVSGPDRPRWLAPSLPGGGAPVYTVAFSPDGRRLMAGGAGGSVLLWDVPPDGRPQRLGPPLPGDGLPVNALRFSPDGSLLVSGGAGGSVVLWDLTDGRNARSLARALPAAVGSVNALAVGPHATWLAGGGGGGRASIWSLSALQDLRTNVVAAACAATGGGLSPEDWNARIVGLDYQDSCPSG